MTNSPLIIHLDATALGRSSCMRRTYYNVIKGYTQKLKNNDIEFGQAVHLFKAEIRKGTEQSFLVGLKKAKDYYSNKEMIIKRDKAFLTVGFLMNVCNEYYIKYVKDDFEPIFYKEEPLVELKFSVPVYQTDTLIVFLSGVIDEIGKLKNGCYAISDLKTTSVWDHVKYFEGYRLSPQLIFYRYMLDLHAKMYPDSIFSEINRLDCGCFIDGIFYKKDQPTEFNRSEMMLYKKELMQEFEILVYQKVKEIISFIEQNQTPLREGMLNGSCITKYGHCDFFNVCSAVDNESSNFVLENNFITRPYDPLTIGD